jgi:transposase-like protein
MSEDSLVDLRMNRHLIECPHCQWQNVHDCAGSVILFAQAKCTRCGGEFVIAMNEPRI